MCDGNSFTFTVYYSNRVVQAVALRAHFRRFPVGFSSVFCYLSIKVNYERDIIHMTAGSLSSSEMSHTVTERRMTTLNIIMQFT